MLIGCKSGTRYIKIFDLCNILLPFLGNGDNGVTSPIQSSKKRKRSSRQFTPDEETIHLPKLKRNISISNMLSGMDLGKEIVVASSSQTRNDQFHNPRIDEVPDTFDDALLYDLGDDDNDQINDNLDDNNDNEDIDLFNDDADIEEDDELFNGDDELFNGDDDIDDIDEDEELFNENLFIAPELENEEEDYKGVELEDKVDIEILIWIFKFQQRYQISDNALKVLIKFLNIMLNSIDESKFWGFPTSLYLVKKMLGIFQPKLRMAVCTNCHKLCDSNIVCNYKENDKLAIMRCNYEEFPNNPIPSRKNLCNNGLSSLKRNKKGREAIPKMLYPKPSIKQQLSILY